MDGKEHKMFIIVASVVPLVGVVVAMVLLWNRIFGWSDLICFAVMYAIAGLGVSIGYHRMLAHRSFKTHRWIYDAFAVAGTIAAQGPAIIWAAHHRRHHRVADKEGDPHSPYHGGGTGRMAVLRGLWHAHLGWLLDEKLTSDPLRYCPDLARDKHLRWISRHFVAIVVAGLLLPAALGFALTGELAGALTGFLWGGLVRVFVLNHITYAINSIGHFHGRRRFSTPDESRNVAWLSLASFGESWHNNHHAFPRSAKFGMRWYEVDISAMVLAAMRRTKLAWDVITIDRERQEARAAGLARVGSGRFAPSTPAAPMAERMSQKTDLVFSAGDVE